MWNTAPRSSGMRRSGVTTNPSISLTVPDTPDARGRTLPSRRWRRSGRLRPAGLGRPAGRRLHGRGGATTPVAAGATSSGRVPVDRSNASCTCSATARTVWGRPEPRLYVPPATRSRSSAASMTATASAAGMKSRHWSPADFNVSLPPLTACRQRSLTRRLHRATVGAAGAPTALVRRRTTRLSGGSAVAAMCSDASRARAYGCRGAGTVSSVISASSASAAPYTCTVDT